MKTAWAGAFLAIGAAAWAADVADEDKTVHDFEVKTIEGKSFKLSAYKDHVVMIVNVASK